VPTQDSPAAEAGSDGWRADGAVTAPAAAEAAAGAGGTQPWYRNPVLRLLVTGSLLNSVAFFATLPFLTLYLSDISTLSPAMIGGVVGTVALIAAFGGFLGGVLTDRFGAVTLIRAGLVLYVAIYVSLAVTTRLSLVICLILLLGVGRVLVEPSMKKLLSLAATGTAGGVFRIRYITLCLGAIVGPLVGAGLYALAGWLIFVLPAVIFAAYLLFLDAVQGRLRALDRPTPDREAKPDWRRALNDRALLLVVGGGFVVFFVFAQFESILPLFLKAERGESAIAYFSVLLAANAALGIAFQYPAERLSRRASQSAVALIGCAAFGVSLVLFAAFQIHPAFLYLGVIAWTVGEAILIPMPDMLIHNLTPDQHKGSYFGLAELRYLGFFLGPVVGGALLTSSAWLYFAVMAVVVFGAWPLLGHRGTAPVTA
jgi:MFS family permease